MSERISVGDLVQIVRPPACGCTHNLGITFQITRVWVNSRHGTCRGCRSTGPVLSPVAEGFSDYGIPIHRLKRIPPLSELEGVKTEEDIRDPA